MESLGAANAKNGVLSGGTYPYRPNMGVPSPRPLPCRYAGDNEGIVTSLQEVIKRTFKDIIGYYCWCFK